MLIKGGIDKFYLAFFILCLSITTQRCANKGAPTVRNINVHNNIPFSVFHIVRTDFATNLDESHLAGDGIVTIPRNARILAVALLSKSLNFFNLARPQTFKLFNIVHIAISLMFWVYISIISNRPRKEFPGIGVEHIVILAVNVNFDVSVGVVDGGNVTVYASLLEGSDKRRLHEGQLFGVGFLRLASQVVGIINLHDSSPLMFLLITSSYALRSISRYFSYRSRSSFVERLDGLDNSAALFPKAK